MWAGQSMREHLMSREISLRWLHQHFVSHPSSSSIPFLEHTYPSSYASCAERSRIESSSFTCFSNPILRPSDPLVLVSWGVRKMPSDFSGKNESHAVPASLGERAQLWGWELVSVTAHTSSTDFLTELQRQSLISASPNAASAATWL